MQDKKNNGEREGIGQWIYNFSITCRFKARAMDRATLVFPTPEGRGGAEHRACPEGRLTWRSREAENLPLHRLIESADGNELLHTRETSLPISTAPGKLRTGLTRTLSLMSCRL